MAANKMTDTPKKTQDNPNRIDPIGLALAIGGSFFFATKSIFAKLAYMEGASTELLLAMRMLVAIPLYLAILAITLSRNPERTKSLTPRNFAAAMGVGALGYWAASYVNFMGLNFISAQLERLVLFTYPFFTLALGVMFFGHKFKAGLIPAMLVSWGGLALIFGWNLTIQPEGLVEGTLLVLFSGILFATYQLLAKGEISRIGSGVFTCIAMSCAGVIALVVNGAFYGMESLVTASPKLWAIGLGLGIIATILPSFMLNAAIGRVGARVTSASGTLGPIMTIILAVTILNEPFTWFHAVGTILVIYGVVLFSRAEQKSK